MNREIMESGYIAEARERSSGSDHSRGVNTIKRLAIIGCLILVAASAADIIACIKGLGGAHSLYVVEMILFNVCMIFSMYMGVWKNHWILAFAFLEFIFGLDLIVDIISNPVLLFTVGRVADIILLITTLVGYLLLYFTSGKKILIICWTIVNVLGFIGVAIWGISALLGLHQGLNIPYTFKIATLISMSCRYLRFVDSIILQILPAYIFYWRKSVVGCAKEESNFC